MTTATVAAPSAVTADQAVRTPYVLREGEIDTRNVESIVKSIIHPGMNDRQKAFAVYDFLRTHMYHWWASREGPTPNSFPYGVVFDPIKLINVYGYGYCFQNRSALAALWQAAGLEARTGGIGGHVIAEVYYDDAWHFLDADQHGYCLLPDGKTVASIAQIEKDPITLILKQKHPSDPFFPATKNPLAPYESAAILAAYFWTTKDNYYQHDKIDVGHTMDITLLPGMRFTRRFQPDGRWNVRNKTDMEYRLGYGDPAVGPKDFRTGTTYANGDLLYQPDLTTRSEEYPAGVWDASNIERTKAGLRPAKGGEPAYCVFRIRLPYLVAGWPMTFKGPPNHVGAAVIAADFGRKGDDVEQNIAVSTNDGRTWQTLWTSDGKPAGKAVVDASRQAVHRYEYLVRFEMKAAKPAQSLLKTVSINTGFQCAPRVLPALREGENRMHFTLGSQAETMELIPSLSNRKDFNRFVVRNEGIRLGGGEIKSENGEEGIVVFKLQPPKPGTVHSFSVGAGCRREPGRLNFDDDIKIYYAVDRQKNWKLIADDDFPRWAGHWSYHLNTSAECPAGTKCVFVMVSVTTAANASVKNLKFRLHWKPDGPDGMPEHGLRVEHGWTEKGKAKAASETVQKAPSTYTVRAGKDPVNTHITLEPVRTPGLEWREDDPPVRKPPLPQETVVDAAQRDELRSLLRAIDENPAEALEKAAKSKVKWLSTTAKQALDMWKKTGGW